MPLIKSAKKRVRVAETKATVNQLHRSGSKTAVRNANRAIASGGAEAAILVAKAASRLDRAAAKGSIHANKAARLKSRLAAKLKATGTEASASKAKVEKATAKKSAPKTAAKKAPVKKVATKKASK